MNMSPKGTFALELGGAATVISKVITEMVGDKGDNTPTVSNALVLKLLVTKVVTSVGGDQ